VAGVSDASTSGEVSGLRSSSHPPASTNAHTVIQAIVFIALLRGGPNLAATLSFMIEVQINGERQKTDAATVEALLESLGLGKQAVAVEVNQPVVRKKDHARTELSEGDRIELVTLVGGG